MVERVQLVAEGHVEEAFDTHEKPLQELVNGFEHVASEKGRRVVTAGYCGRLINLTKCAEYKGLIIFLP
jgi:hypothetical protein